MLKLGKYALCASLFFTAGHTIAQTSDIKLTKSPEGAKVYFIDLKDGDELKNPITIRFGLKNMGVAPAGVQVADTGHHHLLVDAPLPKMDQPIPMDKNHLHFGTGKTETTMDLPEGKHTLRLLMGDYEHVPHNPPVYSDEITVTVK